MNNHFRGQAVTNAFELMSMLSGTRVEAPRELQSAFPRLEDSTVTRDENPDATGSTGWLFPE